MPISRRQPLARSVGIATAKSYKAPPVRTVKTKVLEIAYHELGDVGELPIILLHGFPDDAHAYDKVLPALASAGHRALAVYLRGYGQTKFLNDSAPRMAQQAALGQDVIDFADALGLKRFVVCGYDWGSGAAAVACVMYPERIRAAVLMGGYLIQNTVAPGGPQYNSKLLKVLWYQWYFNIDLGKQALAANRYEICKLLWEEWSPKWRFSDAEYDLTARSFENPDFVDCVVHSYRHRCFNAPGEPRFMEIEKRLAQRPKIEVPTMILYGGDSAFAPATELITARERDDFPSLIARRIETAAGHFIPREKPQTVTLALLDAIRTTQ